MTIATNSVQLLPGDILHVHVNNVRLEVCYNDNDVSVDAYPQGDEDGIDTMIVDFDYVQGIVSDEEVAATYG